MVTDIAKLAKKFRRALRNNRGARFTAEELCYLGDIGMLDMLQAAEAQDLKELWRERATAPSTAAAKPKFDSTASAGLGGGTPTEVPPSAASLTQDAESRLALAEADRIIEIARQARRRWRNK